MKGQCKENEEARGSSGELRRALGASREPGKSSVSSRGRQTVETGRGTHTCARSCTHTPARMDAHAHIQVCTHIYVYAHLHTHVHAWTHIDAHTYTHAHGQQAVTMSGQAVIKVSGGLQREGPGGQGCVCIS